MKILKHSLNKSRLKKSEPMIITNRPKGPVAVLMLLTMMFMLYYSSYWLLFIIFMLGFGMLYHKSSNHRIMEVYTDKIRLYLDGTEDPDQSVWIYDDNLISWEVHYGSFSSLIVQFKEQNEIKLAILSSNNCMKISKILTQRYGDKNIQVMDQNKIREMLNTKKI